MELLNDHRLQHYITFLQVVERREFLNQDSVFASKRKRLQAGLELGLLLHFSLA